MTATREDYEQLAEDVQRLASDWTQISARASMLRVKIPTSLAFAGVDLLTWHQKIRRLAAERD